MVIFQGHDWRFFSQPYSQLLALTMLYHPITMTVNECTPPGFLASTKVGCSPMSSVPTGVNRP